MRGYYIYYTTENVLVGVDKKVENQSKILERYFDFRKVVIQKEKSNILKSIIWRMPFGSFGRNYESSFQEIKDPDFIYIRFVPVDRRFLHFVKELRRRHPDAKILLEIATFPYGHELLSDFSMFPYYFKDLLYRRRLKKYIDRIITFSDDKQIFGIPTIRTLNGIIVEEQRIVQDGKRDDVIRLLAVAMFQKSHGYERCIKGLADYYKSSPSRRIELHMVGEGSELPYYKRLAEKYHLEDYIIFYGKKTGEELEGIYKKADIALGCFGLYKRKIKKISSLKAGEYLAKGLPVVTGCPENVFENKNTEYVLEFPNDETPVPMDEILEFYDKIYGKQRDRAAVHNNIRKFAEETVDMDVAMRPVTEWILSEYNEKYSCDLPEKEKLFLLTDTFPYGSGEKTFILPELPYLMENFDVTIISSATKEARKQKGSETSLDSKIRLIWYPNEEVKGIEVVRYILPFLFYRQSWKEIIAILKKRKFIFARLRKTLFFFSNADKFRIWLEKEKILGPDKIIYYSYWYIYRVLSIAMRYKKYPNVKLVTRAHGYDLYEERNTCCWQPFKSSMDAVVDKVFFISKQGQDYYIKHFAQEKEETNKYVVNYLGTNGYGKDIKKARNTPFLLVSCGSTIPVKRIHLIISALELIEECKIKWVHFGGGSDYDKLQIQAKRQLDGKSNIWYELKGHVVNEDIIRYYKSEQPDCFIMTSSSEGSPVAMQEVLSFGMPVIATAVGGIPEMVDGNGILLSENPGASEIAEAIEDIYDSDESRYQKMRKVSLQIWNRDYNREKNVKEFVQILKQVSNERYQ